MKRFKTIMLKVLVITGSVLGVGAFVVILTAAVQKQRGLVCKGVHADVHFENGINFISAEDVVAKINELSGGQIEGKPLSAVDFRTLERELRRNPYVDHAEVYSDQQQIVHASVTQKQPLIRVINNDGVSYYISDKNERIPLSDNFTANVLLAIGTVETREDLYGDSIILDELYHFAKYVSADSFLNAMVDHVTVNVRGELDIHPKWGGHVVEFGRADEQMAEKFDRLKIFYREGLAKMGWEKYSRVNVKYNGQVVCERRPAAALTLPDTLTSATIVKDSLTTN
ncbi:MAG: hypothetical protein U0T73_06710 [Chitinophagales bacterium]